MDNFLPDWWHWTKGIAMFILIATPLIFWEIKELLDKGGKDGQRN